MIRKHTVPLEQMKSLEQAKIWLGMNKKNMAEGRLPLKNLSEWLSAKANCKTADPRYKEISKAYFEMEKNGSRSVKFRELKKLLREIREYEAHRETMHIHDRLAEISVLLSEPAARRQREKREIAD